MAYSISLLLLVVVTALFFLYKRYQITKLLVLGWEQAQHQEKHKTNYKEGQKTGNFDHEWLFTGPSSTKDQIDLLDSVNLPMVIFRTSKLFGWTLPLLGLRIFIHRLKTGSWDWDPNNKDVDIFDLVTSSTLLILSTLSEDGKLLKVEVPKEVKLETRAKIKLGGSQLYFDIKTKKIVHAVLGPEKKNIKGDNSVIVCLVTHLIMHWAHTQSHILSEFSARDIARNKIKELEPSNRYVVALHTGLMYGMKSPIRQEKHLLSSGLMRDSIIDSLDVPVSHNLDKSKMQFRYFKFLYIARGLLIKHLEKYNISANAEFLFHNMIVHSLDHFLFEKIAKQFKSWTLDGSKSMVSYFDGAITKAIWVPNYASGIQHQYIKNIDATKHPLYKDLYKDLKKVDEEYADYILASTSF